MKTRMKNGNIVITIPIHNSELAGSGNTIVVATSRGVQMTTLTVGGRPIYLQVRAFVYADASGNTALSRNRRLRAKWLKLF
jgi:hypothetical protein